MRGSIVHNPENSACFVVRRFTHHLINQPIEWLNSALPFTATEQFSPMYVHCRKTPRNHSAYTRVQSSSEIQPEVEENFAAADALGCWSFRRPTKRTRRPLDCDLSKSFHTGQEYVPPFQQNVDLAGISNNDAATA